MGGTNYAVPTRVRKGCYQHVFKLDQTRNRHETSPNAKPTMLVRHLAVMLDHFGKDVINMKRTNLLHIYGVFSNSFGIIATG